MSESHIQRSGWLASLACDGGPNLIVYEQCPNQMSSFLLVDRVGVATPHLIRRYFCSSFELRPSYNKKEKLKQKLDIGAA